MWIPKFMVKWLFRIITRKSTVSEKQKWYWNTFYVVRSKALFCKVTVTGRGVPGNHTPMALDDLTLKPISVHSDHGS